ncbi:MAG: hypothetical protein KA248_04655 [Kiritimatiellae bacterium]|nr:hypothetical protein [Kiritimatiellia bacterium]
MKKYAILGVTLALLLGEPAGATLIAGDIAVIAYRSDNPDAFAWVALTDIAAGTVVNFTDSSVSNNLFRWTEHLDGGGPLTWSHGDNVAAGTVISFHTNTSTWSLGTLGGSLLGLSNDGDQIFAYTGVITDLGGGDAHRGDPSGAVLLYGLDFANGGWLTSGASSAGESYVPAGISGVSAVYIGNFDNGYYNGIVAGTPDALRAAIADSANWVLSNTAQDPATWKADGATFTVIPEPGSLPLLGLALLLIRRRLRRHAQ